ncbi:hypothetical protein FN846DRAFT_990135 [Sphaerosporella brunnea]|uniref:Uncharacterized protein n=1 Tax=Sphaerosporella brunnea TaxID=1250544 RepID=A0A5J5EQG6_9PEZI|nr:hypothetical protein FN846DRAFT_990135 [Sphaerosporella brunnea]
MSAIDRVRRLTDSLSQKPQPALSSVTADIRRLWVEWNTPKDFASSGTHLKELKNMTRPCGIFSEQNFWNTAAKSSGRGSLAVRPILRRLVLTGTLVHAFGFGFNYDATCSDTLPPLGTGSHRIQIGQVVLYPEAIPRLFPLNNDPSEDATRLFADTDFAIREALPPSENSCSTLLAFAMFSYAEDAASMWIEVLTLGGIKKNKLNLQGDSKRLRLERAGSLSVGSSGPVADPLVEIERMRALTMHSVVRGGVDERYNFRLRKRTLERTNLSQGLQRRRPLHPGTSISAGGVVARGSFGVFLRSVRRHEAQVTTFPRINPKNFYAITACDVLNDTPLPSIPPAGGRVVSSGALDVLARIHLLLSDYALEMLITKRTSMLAQLRELDEQFNVACICAAGAKSRPSLRSIPGGAGLPTTTRDLLPREKVFKEGATTHLTGGTVDRCQVLAYFKRTTIAAQQFNESTAVINVCEHRLVWPVDEEEHMVQARDSGRAVLVAGPTSLDVVGMFVTPWTEEQNIAVDTRRLPRTLGMMIPQSILLTQIAEATGWEWTIS